MARFGAVGATATLLHLATALALVNHAGFSVQAANLAAFLTALSASFFGHYHFSFRSDAPYRSAAPRFLLVSVAAYLASALLIAVLAAMPIVPQNLVIVLACLVIPAASYAANRLFVFG